MKLKEKHKAFADFYIETGNAAESARRAGYSEKTARQQGARMLTNVDIAAYIEKRTKAEAEKRIAKADEVMEFLTAVMRGEVKDSFGLEPSLADRKDAAKELAKRTVDIENRKNDIDIIKNMQSVAEMLLNSKPDRKLEDYE